MRKFETGATRDSDETKLDYEGFLHPSVLEAYAQYMHKNRVQADGNLRDSDNWQKGIPKSAYMKSMWRHFMSIWKAHRSGGDVSVDELAALMFNVMGYMFERLREGRIEKALDAVEEQEEKSAEKENPYGPGEPFEIPYNPYGEYGVFYYENFGNYGYYYQSIQGHLVGPFKTPVEAYKSKQADITHYTAAGSMAGVVGGEVLGLSTQRPESEVATLAPEVQSAVGYEKAP